VPRKLAWLLLVALTILGVYGFLHERLYAEHLWTAAGAERLAWYALIYWAAAGAILWLRPAWLLPLACLFAVIYSAWWCAEFSDPVAPFAVIYFLGSSFLLGRLAAKNADGILALLLGIAIWMFAISIAVHFPVNTPLAYAIAFAAPYLLTLFQMKAIWSRSGRGAPARAWPRVPPDLFSKLPPFMTAVLLFVLLMHFFVALAPEVSSDGLAMHLAIPMMVARDARFAFDFHQYAWSLMPMGGDFAYTAANLLGGEMAARLLNFAMLVVIADLIYRTSLRWATPAASMTGAALFLSTPLVQLVTGSLFVENIWAALLLGASVAVLSCRWIVAGALLGAALASKLGAFAFLAPMLVIAVVEIRKRATKLESPLASEAREKNARWRVAAGALILIVFAAPPYLNAWLKTGNPVFPFANQTFRSPDFDFRSPLEDQRYQAGVDWQTPYDLTFHSARYFEGQSGSVGFQNFLLLAPMLLLVILNRGAPRVLVAIGVCGAAIIFATQPNLRYLYPALPFFAIGFSWLISAISATKASRGISAVAWLIVWLCLGLNLWFLPAASWYHHGFAIFTQHDFDAYLQVQAPQRELVDVLNTTAPGQPAAFFRGGAIAGLNAPGYSDTWHTYAFYRRMTGARDAASIVQLFRELGIRYLITPVPAETEYPAVRQFVEEWTAPSGHFSGRFQLRNVLSTPILGANSEAQPGSYDDTDAHIEYHGAWIREKLYPQAWGESLSYSEHAGDFARFLFSGRSITYVYTKAPNRGFAQVLIDRKPRGLIDLYAGQVAWQERTVFDGLDPGPHTIEIQVTRNKNPKSSGWFVDLDRFIVNN
jgi:hypothetical protein